MASSSLSGVFLAQRSDRPQQSIPAITPPRQQFQQLLDNIVAAGIPLLSATELDQEIADRRGLNTKMPISAAKPKPIA
jgi:hypothetical protein